MAKTVEKHVFSLFASILLIDLFSGPTISVHPYYEITHGTLYSNNSKQLTHGHYNYPSMTKNGTRSRKTGFLISASISLPYTQNIYHGPKNIVQPSHDITHNVIHLHDPETNDPQVITATHP
jgi:hypothetical protein